MVNKEKEEKRKRSRKKAAVISVSVLCVGLSISYMFRRYDVRWIVSGSMKPTLQVGALCVIDREATHPKKGQIACYVRAFDSMLITHRVSDIDRGVYTFHGDANGIFYDYLIEQKQIYGTVVFHTNIMAKIVGKKVSGKTKNAAIKSKKYKASSVFRSLYARKKRELIMIK